MTDVKVACNELCGCVVPCPGGSTCRCNVAGVAAESHATCACGEHCSCNPCTCGKNRTAAACTCGPGCSCATCVA